MWHISVKCRPILVTLTLAKHLPNKVLKTYCKYLENTWLWKFPNVCIFIVIVDNTQTYIYLSSVVNLIAAIFQYQAYNPFYPSIYLFIYYRIIWLGLEYLDISGITRKYPSVSIYLSISISLSIYLSIYLSIF